MEQKQKYTTNDNIDIEIKIKIKFQIKISTNTNAKISAPTSTLIPESTLTTFLKSMQLTRFCDSGVSGSRVKQSNQKNRGFGFVTFLEKGDAAAAMDNLNNAELYGRVLTCNYAQPVKIKGGEQGWASQPGAVFNESHMGGYIWVRICMHTTCELGFSCL